VYPVAYVKREEEQGAGVELPPEEGSRGLEVYFADYTWSIYNCRPRYVHYVPAPLPLPLPLQDLVQQLLHAVPQEPRLLLHGIVLLQHALLVRAHGVGQLERAQHVQRSLEILSDIVYFM